MSESDSHVGVVACPMCELYRSVSDPNEAIGIYRRHNRVTGHEIDWERTSLDVEASSTDIESVLQHLDSTFSKGVSIGVLTAALSTEGVSIGEVLDELYNLRMEGRVYEPSDGHFRVL